MQQGSPLICPTQTIPWASLIECAHTTRKQSGFKALVNIKNPSDGLIYRVAVPSPLHHLFDYLPPLVEKKKITPGTRVEIPFGQRKVVGVVVTIHSDSDVAQERLKAISVILDREPVFSAELLTLLIWAADYYHCPVGEVFATALPTLLRTGKSLPSETWWQLTKFGHGLPANALKRAPRQAQLLEMLQIGGAIRESQLRAAGLTLATFRTMKQKQLIESFQQAPSPKQKPDDGDTYLRENPLPATQDQEETLHSLNFDGYYCYLLVGETGSGKTEVYLQAISNVLSRGRQALVLIPEISLTPQTLRRFQQRFCCQIAVLHSGLTDKERLATWQAAASGSAAIIIGTRSAIFTPMIRPGIIIVDEEHDSSFKQQEGFRYSARDVAVMRANQEQIPIILGSATPSLESLFNCEKQRYRKLTLSGRPGNAKQPQWRLVDIRKLSLNNGFSAPVIDAMARELTVGHQVLVFLNRRGFAPTLMCHDCGWVASCPRCDTRLTFHQTSAQLLCHHCEYRDNPSTACPECAGCQLEYLGQGTERAEVTLGVLFPDVPVLRVDSDSTRRKNAMDTVLTNIHTGGPCILIGTQILAKGHHFPNVTLVVVLDADSGLYGPDFRATERLGQLITQVAGRAGRGDAPGWVIIQSHHCDHPLLKLLGEHHYENFAERLMDERRLSGMPPFTYLAVARADAPQAASARKLLQAARDYCETLSPPSPDVHYLGPFPAPLERRNSRFRFQLILVSDKRHDLHRVLGQLSRWIGSNSSTRKIRCSIDVDPQDMS
jgi:primosomal protein N' (replication factor Y) (superfamily II helicase)